MSSIIAKPAIMAQMNVPIWAVRMSILPGSYQSTDDVAPSNAAQITRNFVMRRV